ncbi:MAG: hypothetical protein DCC58_07450 [Chloroflexi bacterium]|nr:MAG: hypothetical protein DCC58_07450 [Chloroflexota bacterium]
MVKREATRKNGWTIVTAGATVTAIAVAGMAMGIGDGRENDLLGPIRLQDAEALGGNGGVSVATQRNFSVVPARVIDMRTGVGFDSPLDTGIGRAGGASASIGRDSSPDTSGTNRDGTVIIGDSAGTSNTTDSPLDPNLQTADSGITVDSASSPDDGVDSSTTSDTSGSVASVASVASVDSPDQTQQWVAPAVSADSPEQWSAPAQSADSAQWVGGSAGSGGSWDSD